jgi:cellulase
MRSSILLLSAIAAFLDIASAHGFVTGVKANGAWTAGSDPVWWYHPANSRPQTAGWDALNQDIGFVEPAAMGTADVNCHKSASAGRLYANVNAGDTIQFSWNTWPDSHKGPIINYIAPCNGEVTQGAIDNRVATNVYIIGDCTTLSPTSLRWFKISQTAILTTSPITWVTDALIAFNFTTSTVLPKNLAPGNYVIRHEIIALHGAQNDNGAQLYPQCLNLKVGGSGTVKPTGGVEGTKLYRRDEEGIRFNVYAGKTSYTFPGPAVWTGAD